MLRGVLCVSEFTLLLQGCIDSDKINTPPPWKKECTIHIFTNLLQEFFSLTSIIVLSLAQEKWKQIVQNTFPKIPLHREGEAKKDNQAVAIFELLRPCIILKFHIFPIVSFTMKIVTIRIYFHQSNFESRLCKSRIQNVDC